MTDYTPADMEKARQRAAQAWCAPETSSIEMDARLAEAFAAILAAALATERKACAAWHDDKEAAQMAEYAATSKSQPQRRFIILTSALVHKHSAAAIRARGE